MLENKGVSENAPRSGRGGRVFESRHSDHNKNSDLTSEVEAPKNRFGTDTGTETMAGRPGRRVLVCGGRGYGDADVVGDWLGGVLARDGIAVLIEGGADGADTLARRYGALAKIPIETYPADWRAHGRAAGPIRNQTMIDRGKPDLVVAFPGGAGTADMVRRAKAAGIETIEVVSRNGARTTPSRPNG